MRAPQLLRDEGLLEFRRCRGNHVAGDAVHTSAVLANAHELVELVRREGYRTYDFISNTAPKPFIPPRG